MKILLYSVIFIFSSSNILFAETSNDKKVAIMYSDQFLLHNTGKNHPERPERLSIVVDNLKDNNLLSPHLIWPSVREASKLEIKLVHTQNYIDLVEKEVNSLKKNSISYLSTGDTVISKESNKVARTAVGAGLRGADAIMKGEVSSAFVLSRPPGHHASASKGMGFCIYNNIAIVARYLQEKYDIKRILIVDFANQLRAAGKNIENAIKEACDMRFRPIIMTSLSTMIAMVPLVIGNIGPGAGEGSRLAVGSTILGGMIISTFFTLYVTPTMYLMLAKNTKRIDAVDIELKKQLN